MVIGDKSFLELNMGIGEQTVTPLRHRGSARIHRACVYVSFGEHNTQYMRMHCLYILCACGYVSFCEHS